MKEVFVKNVYEVIRVHLLLNPIVFFRITRIQWYLFRVFIRNTKPCVFFLHWVGREIIKHSLRFERDLKFRFTFVDDLFIVMWYGIRCFWLNYHCKIKQVYQMRKEDKFGHFEYLWYRPTLVTFHFQVLIFVRNFEYVPMSTYPIVMIVLASRGFLSFIIM